MERKDSENIPEEMDLVPSDSRELVFDKAYSCPNCGTVFNKEKVFCPSCGLSIQEMQQPAEYGGGPPQEFGIQRANRSGKIFALLSLILGIAGPLALGVGWLLAIIFGFTALNLQRTRGGYGRDKKFAIWGISLGFFWPIAIFMAIGLYSYMRSADRTVARNERTVEGLLVDIAVAQRFVRNGHYITFEGKNLYALPDELAEIEHRLVPDRFEGIISGYNVQMRVIPAQGFQVTATPERYGATGRRSFYIDETGVLRGGDIGRDRHFQNWLALPRLKENPVYNDYDSVIVESLIYLARRLASEGLFERARDILSEIRTEFYMIPEAARVEEAMESLKRHIYEDNAARAYNEAVSMLDEDRLRDALTALKGVRNSFENALVIPDVNSKIAEVEKKISATLEREARALFEQAGELEKQAEYDSAIEKYRKIVSELDSTSYYQRALALIEAVQSRKLEKEAEELFSEIAQLSIEQSYREAISATRSLINHYSETEFVKHNNQRLTSILNTAIGEREKNNAISAFQQANFSAAIQAGESAIASNPALREKMIPIVRHSYLKRAESLFENSAYSEALGYYESWMEISEYRGTPEYRNYVESLYNVARDEFQEGNFEMVKNRLEGMERYFAGRDDFWYMLGSISASEGDYPRAIFRLRRAVAINQENTNAWYKKALCKIIFVQREEDELKKLIDELFALNRGTSFFYDINSQVTALHSKDLQIRELAAGTDAREAHVRRRAGLRAERDSFEAQTRQKLFEFEESYRKINELRSRVLSKAGSIYETYNEINSHLMRIPPGRRDRRRSEFIMRFRRKKQGIESYFKLERGLNQEMRLEESAMINLEFALTKFAQERSFETEVRDMYRLREGISQMGMQRHLQEGREEILQAIADKIPAEEFLAEVR